MSNLVKRAIFGSLYVGLILAALLLREHLVYMIVFGLLAFLGTWEWSNLVSTHRLFPLRRIFDATAAVYLFWATHEIADKGIAYAAFLVPYAGYLLYILVRSIYSERQAMPTDLAKVIFGQIYVGGFLSIANIFYTDTDTSSSSSRSSSRSGPTIRALIWRARPSDVISSSPPYHLRRAGKASSAGSSQPSSLRVFSSAGSSAISVSSSLSPPRGVTSSSRWSSVVSVSRTRAISSLVMVVSSTASTASSSRCPSWPSSSGYSIPIS